MTIAAAATAAARNPLRRRLIVVLATLSVVLNLCFVAGAVWTRMHRPPPFSPTERFREMASDLKLDPQQKTGFESYFRAMRARTEAVHRAVEPLIAEAWSEVGKPQADETHIMQLFDSAAERRRAFQREATTATIAFLATLTPEQRAKFVAIARERQTRWVNHGVAP